MKRFSGPLRFWPVLTGSTFLSTPHIKGLILDCGTEKPVAGAHVYAMWKRRLGNPDGQVSEETAKRLGVVTNEDGYFEIPSYFLFNPAPSPLGQAGSFAFIVFADDYKIKLFTFHDPESLVAYESCEWRELAPAPKGGRTTIKLSKICDQAMLIDQGDEYEERRLAVDYLEAGRLEAGRAGVEFADGYHSIEDYRTIVDKLDTARSLSEPPGRYVRERIMRARKRLAEDSKKR
jgi:hypothetical protein